VRNLNKLLIQAQPALINVEEAKRRWGAFREANGFTGVPTLLTNPETNTKFAKTPVPVYGFSLSPDKSSEDYAACDYSTPECREGCVAYAGRGLSPHVYNGRVLRTKFLATDPDACVTLLHHDITRAIAKHAPNEIGVRLNAFSDLEWERIAPWLFECCDSVQFYDYTKRPFGSRVTPPNYHLTFSVSEKTTPEEVAHVLVNGGNVAMVLRVGKKEDMPARWRGFDVVDGDASDARYVDASKGREKGVVIGLRPKGRMYTGTWGMVKEVS
jgi:hypothetical protein